MAWIWFALAAALLVLMFFTASLAVGIACLLLSLLLTIVATMSLLATGNARVARSR